MAEHAGAGMAGVCLGVYDEVSCGEILRQRTGIQWESPRIILGPRILETKIEFQFVALISQQESTEMLMDLVLEIAHHHICSESEACQ